MNRRMAIPCSCLIASLFVSLFGCGSDQGTETAKPAAPVSKPAAPVVYERPTDLDPQSAARTLEWLAEKWNKGTAMQSLASLKERSNPAHPGNKPLVGRTINWPVQVEGIKGAQVDFKAIEYGPSPTDNKWAHHMKQGGLPSFKLFVFLESPKAGFKIGAWLNDAKRDQTVRLSGTVQKLLEGRNVTPGHLELSFFLSLADYEISPVGKAASLQKK